MPICINRSFSTTTVSNNTSFIYITIDDLEFRINLSNQELLSDNRLTFTKPTLVHYALCALKGILHMTDHAPYTLMGLDVTCTSTIPIASGLSSSSAIVCNFLLLFNQLLLHQPISDRKLLSDIARRCEQYCGTLSGGMDQAIILNGVHGSALLIEFSPLDFGYFPLPDVSFVVAHSLEESHKAATDNYNIRVIECRLASLYVAIYLGLEFPKDLILRNVFHCAKVLDIDTMLNILENAVPDKLVYLEDVATDLKIDLNFLTTKVVSSSLSSPTNIPFKPYKRALHVLNEAKRVYQLGKLFKSGVNSISEIGKILIESQFSLKDNYECSSACLDELLYLVSTCNAYGRLTGAGWGGMAVIVVEKENVNILMDTLWKLFYQKRGIPDSSKNDLLFEVNAVDGCVVETE
ncbi:hypothetical protein P9112_002954 [Eukaryota sp. TZLM1-RC]